MSESNPFTEITGDEIAKKYPVEVPQWEALVASVHAACKVIWPEGKAPRLVMAAQFGDLPAPLYTSTLNSPCADLGFNDVVSEILNYAHDIHHGVDPLTGEGGMVETLNFDEIMASDSIPDFVKDKVRALVEQGVPEGEIRIGMHIDTHDVAELPETDEVEYDGAIIEHPLGQPNHEPEV